MQIEMDDTYSHLMVEVLWGLFGFLFVMVIFCISLWPMINVQGQQAEQPKQSQKVPEPIPPAPAVVLAFTFGPTGELFFKGKRVADDEIALIVSKTENPKVELSIANRKLVNLFYQCSQHGLAPTVKLAQNNN